jgi:hypothetical protein
VTVATHAETQELPADVEAESPEAPSSPRDDWLSDADDLEWFPEEPTARPRRRVAALAPELDASDPLERVFQRRRAAAVVAVFGVVAVVVVLLLVFSGGSGGGGNPATTPPTTTLPATIPATTPSTTKPVTTTPASTTPAAGATALQVVLPASGKLKKGDTGDAVKALQRVLLKVGNGTFAADGDFGTVTEQAVKDFQLAHGLTVDGVVGAKTAAALNTAVRGA